MDRVNCDAFEWHPDCNMTHSSDLGLAAGNPGGGGRARDEGQLMGELGGDEGNLAGTRKPPVESVRQL